MTPCDHCGLDNTPHQARCADCGRPLDPASTPPDEPHEGPPGLFSSSPYAILAFLSIGTGLVALGSLGLEVLTDRWLAQNIDLQVKFLSLPLGVATLIIGGLTAIEKPRWAAPGIALGLAYLLGHVLL